MKNDTFLLSVTDSIKSRYNRKAQSNFMLVKKASGKTFFFRKQSFLGFRFHFFCMQNNIEMIY
jgi:hypothetical protein